MPGPTATAGVVGLPCSSATNHRDSGAEHQGGCSHVQNPPEVPPYPRGTLFSSNVASQPGMKSSLMFFILQSGEGERNCRGWQVGPFS